MATMTYDKTKDRFILTHSKNYNGAAESGKHSALIKAAGSYVEHDIEVDTEVVVADGAVAFNDGVITITPGYVGTDDAPTIPEGSVTFDPELGKIVVETGYIKADDAPDVSTGTLNNVATEGVTYASIASDNTVIPAEGALYINEGYYPNSKIDLSHLIPDDADYDNAGSDKILAGYEAYDSDGKKLIGTVADGSVKAKASLSGKQDGSITATTTVIDSDNEAVDGVLTTAPVSGKYIRIYGSADITAEPQVTVTPDSDFVAGYITSASAEDAANVSFSPVIRDAADKFIKIFDGDFEYLD